MLLSAPRWLSRRLAGLAVLLSAMGGVAHADPASTGYSLDRLDELLELRIEDGSLSPTQVLPAILVSAEPRYEETRGWYRTRAIEVLVHAFGDSGLRLCEACMVPRVVVERGSMTWQSGPVGLDEVVRLDQDSRGGAQPARTAIWLDETRQGVSVRIVDLRTGRVVFAQNVDPDLQEDRNTQRVYTRAEELERRARGDSITQAFVDMALYPGQHISLDWTEQWGLDNDNLTGITLSLIDPVVGVGAVHYRSTHIFHTLVGGKLILSLPTAVVHSFDQGGDILDPLVTGVGIVRVPFGRSNYGAVFSVSTNGTVGLGISLMNISLLPVIP